MTIHGVEITFSLNTGDVWRRADEGRNVISDFLPGTNLLYTNNNNFCGLRGCSGGSIGGGGSGPVDILFSPGVEAVGLQAQKNGENISETFTVSAYNRSALLGYFRISGFSAQREDGSALFLGVAATDEDRITRVHISSGFVHDDFFFGPVSFSTPVPEPGSGVLCLISAVAGVICICEREIWPGPRITEQPMKRCNAVPA